MSNVYNKVNSTFEFQLAEHFRRKNVDDEWKKCWEFSGKMPDLFHS
jgi:hypothetical protein